MYLAGVLGVCFLQYVIDKNAKGPPGYGTENMGHAPKKHGHDDDHEDAPAEAAPAEPVVAPAEPVVVVARAAPVAVAAVAVPAAPAVAPAPAEPAPAPPTKPLTVAPTPSPLPPGAKQLGFAAGWLIFEEGGGVFATSPYGAGSAAPHRLTPSGVTVGAVLLGENELLIEYPSAFGEATTSLFRAKLPPADEGGHIFDPVPDTLSPAGTCTPPGNVVGWITTGSPLAVRGALVQSGSSLTLALRTQEVARVGNALWLATCKRLGLPPPSIDPSGPAIFSDWQAVATFENGGAISLLGFRDEAAWVFDSAAKKAYAISVDGTSKEVAL